MTQFLLALQFLTLFPIKMAPFQGDDLPKSMRYYPVIGALLGALSALVFKETLRWFTPLVAATAAVISLIFFSGGLHLDGFADMCDGFYGGRDRDHILTIMKDSRVGTMAVLGLFCLLSLKIALLASTNIERVVPALILAPTLGRCSMVWLSALSRYARAEGGTASPYIGRVDRPTFLIATSFCALIAFGLFRSRGLYVMLGTVAFMGGFRGLIRAAIGGSTGDTLGACNELVEVLVLGILMAHA